ncbi:hypothetical protein N8198_02750 [Gammaproteobacteria bacterium]|nr:hypothetical protein [Gammaproteobacteria bacterium]
MTLVDEGLKAGAKDSKVCVAGKRIETVVNALFELGVEKVEELPVFENLSGFLMVDLRRAAKYNRQTDFDNDALDVYPSVFFANPKAFAREYKHRVKDLIPIDRSGARSHLACRSPEPLLWLLLDLGLESDQVRRVVLCRDPKNEFYILRLEELGLQRDLDAELQLRLRRFEPIFFAEPSLALEAESITGARVVDDLAPTVPVYSAPYSSLLFWCEGAGDFRFTLDVLFALGIRNIQAAKVHVADKIVFLVRAADIQSPTVLAKLGSREKVHIFYSAGTSVDAWIEWGWSFGFPDHSYTSLFLSELQQTVFLFENGDKTIVAPPEYFRLLRFMDLHFDGHARLHRIAKSGTFRHDEMEYSLRLTSNVWSESGKQELEDLLREQKEIQDRIDQLREIDGIFEGYKAERVLFFPYSKTHKDAGFPGHFFRNQSISEVRKLRYFYGNAGSLGDGLVVSSQAFAAGDFDHDHEIPRRAYPRDGMVFESCGDWAHLAGLRVLRPQGLDLFPYLEVDAQDRDKIVKALLERVIASDANNAVYRLGDAEQNDIREHPQDYLFFLHPGAGDNLEELLGFVLHQDRFKKFEMKFANMAVFFARSDEEKELSTRSYSDSVVSHYQSQFDVGYDRLQKDLEKAFAGKRASVKQDIDSFLQDMKSRNEQLEKQTSSLDKIHKSITSKRNELDAYDQLLTRYRSKYRILGVKLSSQLDEFLQKTSTLVKMVGQDYQSMVSTGLKQVADEAGTLEKLHQQSLQLQERLSTLSKNKAVYDEGYTELLTVNSWLKENTAPLSRGNTETHLEKTLPIDAAIERLSVSLRAIDAHLKLIEEPNPRGLSRLEQSRIEWMYDLERLPEIIQRQLSKFSGNAKTIEGVRGHFKVLRDAMVILDEAQIVGRESTLHRKQLRDYRQRFHRILHNHYQSMYEQDELRQENSLRRRIALWMLDH